MKGSYCILLFLMVIAYNAASAQVDVTKEMELKMTEAVELVLLERAGDLAIQLLHPNSTREEEGPFFAYNADSCYKVVFWDSVSSPIYATVTFDTLMRKETARIDRTIRPFSLREVFPRKMFLEAAMAASTDCNARTYENMYPVLIPISSQELGNKVYIYGRMKDGSMLYGSELIYEFDSTGTISRRLKPHDSAEWMPILPPSSKPYLDFSCHRHMNEKQPDFTAGDLATALYYNFDYPVKKFLMIEDEQVYVIDFDEFNLTLWDKKLFTKEYVPQHPVLKPIFPDPSLL